MHDRWLVGATAVAELVHLRPERGHTGGMLNIKGLRVLRKTNGTKRTKPSKMMNEGQSLINSLKPPRFTSRLILLLILLVSLSTFPKCNSDFNVILPEICNHPGLVNLTWIRSMVLLGIREEQTQPILNILSSQEICDGSNGLLKFISLAYSNPSGKMIASLKQSLCPTAATFCHLNKRQFISWTCSQMPGIQSVRPEVHDVILAIQRMLSFSQWKSIAFTKSRFDRSPFCDEVGAYLQYDARNNRNISVLILGNYEDLNQYESMSFTYKLDGLFQCISYDYGFTHNLSLKTEFKTKGWHGKDVPTVLLLQWPLPVEIFSPENPTLAVVADTYPRIPTTSSFDFQQKNWEPLETSGDNVSPHKLLETLLAQMILKSVKMSLEMDRKRMEEESSTSQSLSPSSSSSGGGVVVLPPKNDNPNFHHFPRHYGQGLDQESQMYPFQLPPGHQFLFSVLQFEKARWHPLINLVNGEKHFTSTGPSGLNKRTHKDPNTHDRHDEYLITWLQIVLGLVVSGIAAFGVIIAAVYARKKARKRDFSSAKHCRKLSRRHRAPGSCKLILTPSDVTFGPFVPEPQKKPSKSPFIGGLPSFQRNSQEKPDLLKGSFSTTLKKQSSVTNMKNEPSILASTVPENTARYKGDLVFLKKLPLVSSDSFEVKMKSMLVLETLHGLRHENLAAMIGFFTGNFPALVWELCSRGSLHDIIKQSDIKLDWAFKLSLLTDLVRGMRYLHSSLVRVHGFLTSHNCVIDARWVLKITDYGLPALVYTQGLSIPMRCANELLWTAPELLREESLRQQGTQAGDVYSFAIIMQEVLVRGEPYCMLTLTAEEILEKVKKPPPLIRPSVSKGAAPPEAINIMRQCWAELPDMRPDFMVIHDLFKTLNHGRKANIVDTMFQMLEKYSNNLEELIRERTEQLDLEKKKTEQLLNRMLPNTVAEKLKLGLPFDPEEFTEVTIYFSDIVGFTTISAYSTPFEVVDLLNDLYTCFDATINDYNVYKVETIGDAYMVVGGAPLWSPDHSDQIATMALDLLHQSGKFRIRHLPYTPLRLRIGLHTGPCCAGVVGLTMPRYCLFGDTVNTASRMESTGAPWRIHVSGETKAKLDEAGGYIMEYRGMTDIKGKGRMPTYWLLGKTFGFDKELPTPPGLEECHRLDENAIKYGRTGEWPAGIGSQDPSSRHNNKGKQGQPSIILPGTSTSSSGNSKTSTAATTLGNLMTGVVKSVGEKVYGESSSCRSSMKKTGSASSHHLAPPKSSSSFAVVSGETIRSLSPAEQIAHQLLNGRPTTKGLRRQLSLDHRAMPVLMRQVHKACIRRAPSLEENLENPSSSVISCNVLSSQPPASSNVVNSYATTCEISGNSSLGKEPPNPLSPSKFPHEKLQISSSLSTLNASKSLSSSSHQCDAGADNSASSPERKLTDVQQQQVGDSGGVENSISSKEAITNTTITSTKAVSGSISSSTGVNTATFTTANIGETAVTVHAIVNIAKTNITAATVIREPAALYSNHPQSQSQHISTEGINTISSKVSSNTDTAVHDGTSSSVGNINSIFTSKSCISSNSIHRHPPIKLQIDSLEHNVEQRAGADSNKILAVTGASSSSSSGPSSAFGVINVPVYSTSGLINNTSNYVLVDGNTMRKDPSVTTGLTVTSAECHSRGCNSSSSNSNSSEVICSSGSVIITTANGTLLSSKSEVGIGGGSTSGCVLRLNSNRAAKLAKILSVVEESESPCAERKYEIVTNQV